MSPEKDNQLCRNYPILYKDRYASMYATCMCWGFECGDGWFDLLDELSGKLEAMNDRMRDEALSRRGRTARFSMWLASLVWDKPLDLLCDDVCNSAYKPHGQSWWKTQYRRFVGWFSEFLRPFPRPNYILAVQVKEKYGTLRYYTNTFDDEADGHIRDAEKKSEKTCESCGKPGKPRGGGWIRTLCEECNKPDEKSEKT